MACNEIPPLRLWLAVDALPPGPSPARITGKKIQALMAGEGSLEERGLRPLSNFPPSQTSLKWSAKDKLFERGTKGVSTRTTKCKQNPGYLL
jgi:hypothetical protein